MLWSFSRSPVRTAATESCSATPTPGTTRSTASSAGRSALCLVGDSCWPQAQEPKSWNKLQRRNETEKHIARSHPDNVSNHHTQEEHGQTSVARPPPSSIRKP